MTKDFRIEYISTHSGKYAFHQGRKIVSINEVTKEQLIDYIEDLNGQLSLVMGAIRNKDDIKEVS